MKIHLAPMEGVVNARMRSMLTAVGGIDRCVTEFVRVSDQLLPSRVFYRLCPELHQGGVTPHGVPVYVQLLGSDPTLMAENAHRAAILGAPGIDTNFGCPAKCVNRHRGGSVLLDEPELLYQILTAMRRAVPAHIPVTAKVRLGYQNASRFSDIVDAVSASGASELTVHARTREDGYKPPAHWHVLRAEAEKASIPIIANGEVWNPDHFDECRRQSGCRDVMLGRGLLARPDLALEIKTRLSGAEYHCASWHQIMVMLNDLLEDSIAHSHPRHVGGPVKQWLGYLRRHYPQAGQLFESIKRLKSGDEIGKVFNLELHSQSMAA